MLKLDTQQKAIVNATENKICVIAGAGSGKTGTTIERVRKLLQDGNDPRGFVCITFTKMAAQEMKTRLEDIPGSEKMFIGTIHSFAYKLLSKLGVHISLLTPEKEREITRNLIRKYAKHLTLEQYDKWASKHRLMELGYYKKHEVENTLNADEAYELHILFDHIEMKHIYESMSKENVDKLIKKVLERESDVNIEKSYPETMRSAAQKMGFISFNALLEMCSTRGVKPKIKYLFVDEFQDVGAFEYKFLMGLEAENVFVVGDDYQCQPENTVVTMWNGDLKKICEINPGDEVVSWDFNSNNAVKGIVRTVQKHLAESLVCVKTDDGKVSRYTRNHRCYVWNDGSIDGYSPRIVAAGNLCINHSVLSYDIVSNTISKSAVNALSGEHFEEETNALVYCLDVDTYHNYVADGIVTHNSIYSFKGSDFEYFKKLTHSEGFKTYMMENNYRCEKHIVEFGDKIIQQIDDVIPKKCVSKVKSIIKGSVVYKKGKIKSVEEYLKCIDIRDYGKWFILTRSNDDLVDISRLCYRMGIPTVTFKKSGLNNDKLSSLLAENSLKLLTVHSAKGLESDNVLLYGNFPLDKNKEYWEERGTEECRVFYVGATRAKKNLIVISNQED